MDYPRYMTFTPEAWDTELRRIGKVPRSVPLASSAQTPVQGSRPLQKSQRSRGSKLLKEHTCLVAYPDGTSGMCQYERLGPTCHRFTYRYGDSDGEGVLLCRRQYLMQPMGNTPSDIEQKCQEQAPAAFAEAIFEERRNYFARASEPSDGSRTKDPKKYQMSAARAKQLGGKYTVGYVMGERILPISPALPTIEKANEICRNYYRDHPDSGARVVVACCNRLDRCWEVPKYNTYKPLLKPEGTDGV